MGAGRDAVAQQLVWLPTWHQARLLSTGLGVDPREIAGLWPPESTVPPGEELLGMYRLILERLPREDTQAPLPQGPPYTWSAPDGIWTF